MHGYTYMLAPSFMLFFFFSLFAAWCFWGSTDCIHPAAGKLHCSVAW